MNPIGNLISKAVNNIKSVAQQRFQPVINHITGPSIQVGSTRPSLRPLQQSITNFATQHPKIANTALKMEQPFNNLSQNLTHLPQVQFATNLQNKIKNPIARTVASIPLGMAEGFVNAPSMYTKGIVQTGLNMGTMYNGGKVGVKKLLGDAAPTAEAIMNVGGFGAAKQIAKQSLKAPLKVAFKDTIKKGALQGAGYGGVYGLLQGLEDAKNTKNNRLYTQQVATPALQGALAGGVLGGGVSSIGYGAGALRKKLTDLIQQREKVTPEIADKAVSGFLRDEMGRFTGKTKNKVEPMFYSDLREQLGLPRNGQYNSGAIDFNAKVGGEKSFIPSKEWQEVPKGVAVPPGGTYRLDQKTGKSFAKWENPPLKEKLGKVVMQPREEKILNSKGGKQMAELKQKVESGQDPFIKGLEEDMAKMNTTAPKERIEPQPRIPNPNVIPTAKKGEIVPPNEINVNEKVNFMDKFRTPDRVMEKLGLADEAKGLRQGYESYQKELPKEIERVTKWQQQVPDPESSVKIFRYLDGQDGTGVTLNPKELVVAKEIKGYLKEWAKRLNLPEDKQISNYITHIFEKGVNEKEFDPELEKILADKVPGSVYDPFMLKRKGKKDYVEDVWRALDAYVKRGTRKANMDPHLKNLSDSSGKLDLLSWNYVKKYADRINMRPTDLDNELDNFIKSTPIGYSMGQRPITAISQKVRQTIFRGALGLNVGSAVRNLTQGINTYAKLGEKYTPVGYTNLIKNWTKNGLKELEEQGILGNDIVQDRGISVLKSKMQKLDKGLFFMFEQAEKINRGAAYFGAKAKALDQGKTEPAAIEFAKKIVRDTQFQFGSIDTPQVLSSDISKTLFQFMSYPLKQTEFLGEMLKKREVAGIVRYIGATMVISATLGKAFGMKPQDMIPFYSQVQSLVGTDYRGSQIPNTPLQTIGQGIGSIPKAITGDDKAIDNVFKAGALLVPAGSQIKKTLEGLDATNKGYSTSATGKAQFPISTSLKSKLQAGAFGKYSTPEAQQYFKNKEKVLSDNQTEMLKQAPDKQAFYDTVMQARDDNAKVDKLKTEVNATGQGTVVDNKYIYNDNGTVRTIDLSPPTPGKGIDAFIPEGWQYPKARQVYSSSLSQDQKNSAYQKLGVTPQEVEYDYKANHTNDIKSQYVLSKADNLTHDQLLNEMVSGRREGVSGTKFASDGVIDSLNQAGYLSDAETKQLKALKLDKNGTPIIKKSKAKKPKKVTFKKVKLAKLKKSKKIKIKQPKFKKFKPLQAKSTRLRAKTI